MLKDYEIFPSPTNMRQVVFPFLVKNRFVPSSKVVCPSKKKMIDSFYNSRINDTSATISANASSRRPYKRNEAIVVLPSSWARLGIRSYHVLREIACIHDCRFIPSIGKDDLRIESTPRIHSKKTWEAQPFSLWVSRQGQTF